MDLSSATAHPATLRAQRRPVGYWLLVVAAMIFVMVVLGGLTRLTHSGLSMVTWEPIGGVLPPLSQAEWEDAFAAYRQTPEFHKRNPGMTLAGYKAIFWLEYVHRLWGRAIGVVFLVPFLYFLVRKRIDRGLVPRLAVVFVLGGLQGLLGWYMVQSGLIDNPDVSHHRLALHLGAAFLLYGYILWVALGLLRTPGGEAAARGARATRFGVTLVLVLVFVTVLVGGLVAGLDAGFMYNTFPKMEGQWVPDIWLAIVPAWANFIENAATVQFEHRVLALTTAAVALIVWAVGSHQAGAARAQGALNAMALMALVQVGLGIATLLSVVALPLAAAHQAGAMLLFTTVVWALRELKPPRPTG